MVFRISSRHASCRKGFTLFEMLIVLGVVMIITVITLSAFSRFNETQVLNGAASKAVSVLRDARARTLASTKDRSYGVHFASTTLTLFAGTSYSPGAADNEHYTLPRAVTVDTVSLAEGGTEIVFNRLSGETDDHGTITLALSAHATGTRNITISEAGITDIKSP